MLIIDNILWINVPIFKHKKSFCEEEKYDIIYCLTLDYYGDYLVFDKNGQY